jgi:hypothetical protein
VWGNEIDSDFKLPGIPVPSDRKFEAATAATTGGSGDA